MDRITDHDRSDIAEVLSSSQETYKKACEITYLMLRDRIAIETMLLNVVVEAMYINTYRTLRPVQAMVAFAGT